MNPDNSRLPANVRRFIILVVVAVIAFCVYQLSFTIYVLQTTGTLEVSSSNNSALISISQEDHEAKVIGTGAAKAHLKPGSYLVSASQNGYQTSTVATITTKQTTNISLKLASASSSTTANKLLGKLPFLGPNAEYEITATILAENNSSGPVITITTATPQGKQDALQWIKDQGLNPTDFTIKYQTTILKNYHYTNGLP